MPQIPVVISYCSFALLRVQLFEWDKDNVIITGSSDGVVRMWALEYVKASAGAFTGGWVKSLVSESR